MTGIIVHAVVFALLKWGLEELKKRMKKEEPKEEVKEEPKEEVVVEAEN